MTNMTFTVSREVEVHVFDVPQDDRFVLVHARFEDEKSDKSSVIMRRSDFEKVRRTGNGAKKLFKSAIVGKEKSRHAFNSSSYPIVATSVNREYLERRTTGDGVNDYHKMRELKWGQPMPEDHVVIGFGRGTDFLYDLDGNPIAQAVHDSYLDQYYDIQAMLDNEAENPDVAFPESYGQKIYFVPGNGDTLQVSFRLSAEKAREYIETQLETVGSSRWLEENTVLGKYKRAEPLKDDDDY